MATSGVVTSNSYSVELVLEFLERDSGWRRILDVHNRADDTGFYVNPSNGLEVFPTAGATNNFVANAYRHVVLTDDSGVVKGYLDGGLEFTSSTTLMDVDANNLMSFFLDNIAAGGQGEFADGKIALLRLYDGVLSDSAVAQLAASPFVPQAGATPEPASLGVLAIGAVGLLWRRRPQKCLPQR